MYVKFNCFVVILWLPGHGDVTLTMHCLHCTVKSYKWYCSIINYLLFILHPPPTVRQCCQIADTIHFFLMFVLLIFHQSHIIVMFLQIWCSYCVRCCLCWDWSQRSSYITGDFIKWSSELRSPGGTSCLSASAHTAEWNHIVTCSTLSTVVCQGEYLEIIVGDLLKFDLPECETERIICSNSQDKESLFFGLLLLRRFPHLIGAQSYRLSTVDAHTVALKPVVGK